VEHPEKVAAISTTISCLVPLDETWHTSMKFQCAACRDALEAPAREAIKRRRAKEKKEQEKRLKHAVECGDPALQEFKSKVDELSLPQLNDLSAVSARRFQLCEVCFNTKVCAHLQ
jgi:hypothetical protein